MVTGHNYTSNLSKLLQHLNKLRGMQLGHVSPVMVHLAPTNKCNLSCSFCCYANRNLRQGLTAKEVLSAIVQFRNLGTVGLEWTGGGEPTLWPHLDESTEAAVGIGYKVGLITNAVSPKKFSGYHLLDWCRVSLHGLDQGKNLDAAMEHIRNKAPELDISSVYIWNGVSSEQNFQRVVEFTERWKVPTRVTPDLTAGCDNIDVMMARVGDRIRHSGGSYVFLSDFNVKTVRAHSECYMHMIKPFVFPDGNVYACPSAALSPENKTNVNEQFKVCAIGDIFETYKRGVAVRHQDCQFCKYAVQNEFISELLRPVTHPEFA